MAKARFHSFRGEKSALILVKANAFVFSADPVYIPRQSLPTNILEAVEALKEGEELDKEDKIKDFTIPDGYHFIPLTSEDGEIRTTKDGKALHSLSYAVVEA